MRGTGKERQISPLSFGTVTFISSRRLVSIGDGNNGARQDPWNIISDIRRMPVMCAANFVRLSAPTLTILRRRGLCDFFFPSFLFPNAPMRFSILRFKASKTKCWRCQMHFGGLLRKLRHCVIEKVARLEREWHAYLLEIEGNSAMRALQRLPI